MSSAIDIEQKRQTIEVVGSIGTRALPISSMKTERSAAFTLRRQIKCEKLKKLRSYPRRDNA